MDQPQKCFLTSQDKFTDVSRGNPKPYALKGDALLKARLTPETWRLEIVSDGSTQVEKPRQLDDGTAIDLPALEDLGKRHGIRFLKAIEVEDFAQLPGGIFAISYLKQYAEYFGFDPQPLLVRYNEVMGINPPPGIKPPHNEESRGVLGRLFRVPA